jgi:hypothetical protein
MPRGDRTGPMGMGPLTGRGAGYCAGYDVPGYMNPGPGRGFGYGMGGGRGRGWRNWYYATGLPGWARFGYAPAWGAPPPPYGPYAAPPAGPTPEQETETLQTQARWLQEQLDAINRRIEELGKE